MLHLRRRVATSATATVLQSAATSTCPHAQSSGSPTTTSEPAYTAETPASAKQATRSTGWALRRSVSMRARTPSGRSAQSNVQTASAADASASAAALGAERHGSSFSTKSLESGASSASPWTYAISSHTSAPSWNRGSRIRSASHASTAASADQTIVSVASEKSAADPTAASVSPSERCSDDVSRSRR